MKREKECTGREGEGSVCNDGGRVFVVSEANGNCFRVWLRMCGVCHVLSCTYAHVCMYVCVCVCVSAVQRTVEVSQHSKYFCDFCGKYCVKRVAVGIWYVPTTHTLSRYPHLACTRLIRERES